MESTTRQDRPPGRRGEYDRWAHRRGEPRQFVVWWSAYLLVSSILAMGGMGFIGLAGYEIFRPAVQILLTMTAVGLAILWPMVRLSQEGPSRPLESFALDGLVLLIPGLAVLATQCMPWMAGWPPRVGLTVAASYVAWAAASAGLLTGYFTRWEGRLSRWALMAAIVALAGLGPVLALAAMWLGAAEGAVEFLLMLSPLTATLEATRDRSWLGVAAEVSGHHVAGACAPAALALIGWMGRSRRGS